MENLYSKSTVTGEKEGKKQNIKASLGTPFSQGFFIFLRKNKLIFLGKMKIP
jgi:Na+-translocating ferredoxin:NAD+ oxidoreductase RnfC subunit